jgi:hypothetical protein
MSTLSQEFLKRIARSVQEEEVDVYVLTLHHSNDTDLKFFNEEDRKRVKKILDVLIEDTRHHKELLELIVEIGK